MALTAGPTSTPASKPTSSKTFQHTTHDHALAVSATATVGMLLSTAMLIMFSVAIAVALGRGSTAGCRCFGPVQASSTAAGAAHPAGIAVALVTAGVVAAVAIAMDDIIMLFTAQPMARG